jgi:hypothetical protein
VNGHTIQKLAWLLPTPEPGGRGVLVSAELDPENAHELEKFARAYKMLDFGWRFAKQAATHEISFPICLLGDGPDYLYRAYLYNINPSKYRDKSIIEALMLTSPEFAQKRAILDAMLISDQVTIPQIAEYLGLPVKSIEAYAELFFNVRDRWEETSYIAEVVYPDGRDAEMLPGYITNEATRNRLLRTGYNNGSADVLFFGGFKYDMVQSVSAKDISAKLEAYFLLYGYLMARNGFVNAANLPGAIQAAKSTLIAAKQGGETNVPTSPFAAVGKLLHNELQYFANTTVGEQIAIVNKGYKNQEMKHVSSVDN